MVAGVGAASGSQSHDAFGDPVTGLGPGPATWSEVVTGLIEVLRRAYGHVEDVPAAVVSAGLALLGTLADSVSPVVAHLDLYLPNVLLGARALG